MMSVTHMAIAVSATSLVFSTANPIALGIAAIGSLLPDLDTSSSLLGQIFFPVSYWIEERYPHRSITHSILASMAIAVLISPLAIFQGWQWWCLPFGHLVSCFSDCFTLQGGCLIYADLSDADLSGANLTGAILINTDFSGADLTGAYR